MKATRLILRNQVRYFLVKIGLFRFVRNCLYRLRKNDTHHQLLQFYSKLIGPGDLVFDVGANRGQSAEVFSNLGAHIIAFEPQTELHSEIRHVCRPTNHLLILPLGLGETEESRTLFISSFDQTSSLRSDWEGDTVGSSTISVSTLDRQIAIHGRPHYCKIDAEGWELQILRGLSHPIPLISFEFHSSPSELPSAKLALDQISTLGAYDCNFREASSAKMALTDWMPVNDFQRSFPNSLGVDLTEGYGDIFCRLRSENDRIAFH
ncbi:FkbM family methyltransferase [Phragmitibacter flavus]|uniref:FkbM family methyltransferase n=1 Tax=Phragmitibacter flavus TaxID=2576071 RepID=A0A5R8KCH9_9BACT|nr:FkbM family methyltransferase [Phragmitibacter flavus]TLD69947.1 FkbM family methyltransferase [Phragmitibacter flavus]